MRLRWSPPSETKLVVVAMACPEDGRMPCPPMTFTETDARAASLFHYKQWALECFLSHQATEPDWSASEHGSSTLLHDSSVVSGAVGF